MRSNESWSHWLFAMQPMHNTVPPAFGADLRFRRTRSRGGCGIHGLCSLRPRPRASVHKAANSNVPLSMGGREDRGRERKGRAHADGLEGGEAGDRIGCVQTQGLAVIALGHRVIEQPRGMDVGLTRHECRVPPLHNLSKSDTLTPTAHAARLSWGMELYRSPKAQTRTLFFNMT